MGQRDSQGKDQESAPRSMVTYEAVRRKRPLARCDETFLLRIRVFVAMFPLAAAIVFLWERRLDPLGGWHALGMWMLLLFTCLAATLILGVFTGGVVLMYETRWKVHARGSLWCLAPAALFLVACLGESLPHKWAFAWSRTALERAALEAKANPATGAAPRTLGVLPVDWIREIDGRMTVHVAGSDSDFEHRLVWGRESGPPRAGMRIMSLGNGWYFQSY